MVNTCNCRAEDLQDKMEEQRLRTHLWDKPGLKPGRKCITVMNVLNMNNFAYGTRDDCWSQYPSFVLACCGSCALASQENVQACGG